MNIVLYISIFLFLLICLFMILLVLIQKGRGGGLASAFGGAQAAIPPSAPRPATCSPGSPATMLSAFLILASP